MGLPAFSNLNGARPTFKNKELVKMNLHVRPKHPIPGNVVDSNSGCVGLIDILENQITPGKLVCKNNLQQDSLEWAQTT